MLARLFPADPARIYQEAYEGAVSALYAMPVSLGISFVSKLVFDLGIPYIV